MRIRRTFSHIYQYYSLHFASILTNNMKGYLHLRYTIGKPIPNERNRNNPNFISWPSFFVLWIWCISYKATELRKIVINSIIENIDTFDVSGITLKNKSIKSTYPPQTIGSSSKSCISYLRVMWNIHEPIPTHNSPK